MALAPAAHAGSEGRRNTAVILGGVAAYGLSKGNTTTGVIAGAAAAAAYKRYRDARDEERYDERYYERSGRDWRDDRYYGRRDRNRAYRDADYRQQGRSDECRDGDRYRTRDSRYRDVGYRSSDRERHHDRDRSNRTHRD
jgi:hypothetical protein